MDYGNVKIKLTIYVTTHCPNDKIADAALYVCSTTSCLDQDIKDKVCWFQLDQKT